jgi:hypothetical protein
VKGINTLRASNQKMLCTSCRVLGEIKLWRCEVPWTPACGPPTLMDTFHITDIMPQAFTEFSCQFNFDASKLIVATKTVVIVVDIASHECKLNLDNSREMYSTNCFVFPALAGSTTNWWLYARREFVSETSMQTQRPR